MMYSHPRSVADNVFQVWHSPGRFTKNPDMVRLPGGRLLLVYSDNDSHWSQETQILTILASDDDGRTWFKLAEVDRADLRMGDERLVTPRLSLLSDGRLVVLIDHDDHGHFHVDQPPGNWAYWSNDGGATWSHHQVTGITGFEPDRMMELPDGSLAVATHVMLAEGQEFADVLTCSTDGGKTWQRRATIAYDGYHRFCEGAIVLLRDGEIACVMRENHSRGIPSFVAFSADAGHTWSKPQRLPFAIHRPYVKQLPDGRVLVTGRHVNGPIGTYAWAGDLQAEVGAWSVGGPRSEYQAELTPDALVIRNTPGLPGCRYTFLPPESSRSEVLMEAEVKVEGAPGEAVAFMAISYIGATLHIASDGIWTRPGAVDFRRKVDMTGYHKLTIHHRAGWLQVQVDGQTVIHHCIFREDAALGGWYGDTGALSQLQILGQQLPAAVREVLRQASTPNLAGMTQFGEIGDAGRSFWKSFKYEASNPSIGDAAWAWRAAGGEWPDQYQRDRLIQIHANELTPDHHPDHGYSSWLTLPDGRIIFVDYTNLGDPPGKSHLVGAYLTPEEIA